MDKQEFDQRTQLLRHELGNDELFGQIELAARQDERVQLAASHINDLRLANRTAEERAAVEENRDLIDGVRRELLMQNGLPASIQELEDKIDQERLEKLKEIHEGLRGDETEDELLKAFNLTDEEGKLSDESLRSPLFRERTQMAFAAYRSAVTSFEALVDYNRLVGVPTTNVAQANQLRIDAHDAVAREVVEDLGLDFRTARKLVAKIRDSKIPKSGEENAYAKSIRRVGSRLSRHYNGDVAEVMKDKLQRVLESESSDTHSENS